MKRPLTPRPHGSENPGVARLYQKEPVDDAQLFAALSAMREAEDPTDPGLRSSWRVVDAWMKVRYGQDPAAMEAHQEASLDIMRAVSEMRAQTPREAAGWIAQIRGRALKDHYRAEGRAQRRHAAKAAEELHLYEPTPPPSPGDPEVDDAAQLEDYLGDYWDAVWDMVDEDLEAHVTRASKRAGDRLRAEVAIERFVRERSVDEIRGAMPAPSRPTKQTLSKWFERGRDDVLLPALARCLGRTDLEDDVARFFAALREQLLASRRADHGVARQARRRSGGAADGSVSPAEDDTSVQVSPSKREARARKKTHD